MMPIQASVLVGQTQTWVRSELCVEVSVCVCVLSVCSMYVLQCGARTGSVIDARRPGDIICAHGVECSSGSYVHAWGRHVSFMGNERKQFVASG